MYGAKSRNLTGRQPVLAAWATEGDITIAVITVPLGLMCLFSKKMLIVDNYYFATEERAIHGRKNNTAY